MLTDVFCLRLLAAALSVMGFWPQATVEAVAVYLINNRRLPVFFGDINRLGAVHWPSSRPDEIHVGSIADSQRLEVMQHLLKEQLRALQGMLNDRGCQ
jgi:hypothetical protein